MDITQPEEKIFSSFSEQVQQKIHRAEEQLHSRLVALREKKNDELFTLFYAFYKDDAYKRRLVIPTYLELKHELDAVRDASSLLYAYHGKIPVAAVWAITEANSLRLLYSGSVKLGYEAHADYFLFWEAVRLAKKQTLHVLSFDKENLFHGMMGI